MQLVPMSEFKKQGIKPQVGMAITSEGNTGIIRSVSGGRVRLDFNHELAGKTWNTRLKWLKLLRMTQKSQKRSTCTTLTLIWTLKNTNNH